MRSEIFKNYLDSILPQGLSKKQKEEIRMEFENHLDDKTDRFIEIGYGYDEAAKKAVAEMGESAAVREELLKIHKKNFWLPFIICSSLLFGLMVSLYSISYDYLYWVIDNSVTPNPHTVKISFIVLNVMLIAIFLCRVFKKTMLLRFLGVYFVIADLLFFPFGTFLGAFTQPALYALLTNINKFFGNHLMSVENYNMWMLVHLVFYTSCTVYCFYNARKISRTPVYTEPPKKKRRVHLPLFASLIILTIISSVALYNGYMDMYETRGAYQCLAPTEKYCTTVYPNVITAIKRFEKATIGMTPDEVDKVLGKENSADKTTTDLYSSNITGDLKKYTNKFSVYEFVKNPHLEYSSDPQYLVIIVAMFDTKGVLIGKEYQALLDFNNWYISEQNSMPSLKDNIEKTMQRKNVLALINKSGGIPYYIICQNVSGNVTDTYNYDYDFGPFNSKGGDGYCGRLSLKFDEDRLTVINGW